ncbi:polysaccharide pyruvyl transferase family protein [Roseovarius salis]|uniref:polysaccharide pyruvyl transferase family protein n=1 Tax=Roseovarius salis TaxID=3376063 RepID=UPI0037CC96E5
MRKIVIFGLPYSPNTGDGVIADCLRAGLKTASPGVDVHHVDISGRTGFGAVTVRNRAAALAVLRLLPRPAAQALVVHRLGRMLDGFEPLWRDTAKGADLAVIGGGQIFSDADLNFCLKIDRIARILRELACPTVVHGAGVARNWTPRGARLFRTLLDCDLQAVGLRDDASIRAWTEQMGDTGPAPRLTRDPALIAADVYHPTHQGTGWIGLCVTDPAILSYHAEGRKNAIRRSDSFAVTALGLAARGHRVALFCNGAAEDRAALDAVRAHPDIAAAMFRGEIRAETPPDTPAGLAAIVARLDAVVAHRLHACILAYAFKRPVVGLGWDRKLESFLHSVGLERFFLPAAEHTHDKVAVLLEEALGTGIDPARHATVVSQTRASIAGITNAGRQRLPGMSTAV